jgi:hypothetical protein
VEVGTAQPRHYSRSAGCLAAGVGAVAMGSQLPRAGSPVTTRHKARAVPVRPPGEQPWGIQLLSTPACPCSCVALGHCVPPWCHACTCHWCLLLLPWLSASICLGSGVSTYRCHAVLCARALLFLPGVVLCCPGSLCTSLVSCCTCLVPCCTCLAIVLCCLGSLCTSLVSCCTFLGLVLCIPWSLHACLVSCCTCLVSCCTWFQMYVIEYACGSLDRRQRCGSSQECSACCSFCC